MRRGARSFRKLVPAACVVAVAVAVLSPAPSGAAGSPHEERSYDHRKVLGPDYEKTSQGHYKVRLRDGKVVYTHGPDFPPDHGKSIGPGDPERAPVCATDYYQHVLYGRPASATDRYSTVKPQIQAIMRRINAVLNEDSVESGNKTADYKVLCDGAGQIHVGRFANSGGASFSDIINAAKAAGFNGSNADYTIFYDGAGPSGTCGIGSLYPDERLVSGNYNQVYTGFGISYSGCWEMTPMHENGHNQGAVQFYAPNGTGSGYHCQDEIDVMCYADGGSRFTGIIQRCTDELHFDCNHDDYFDSVPESGEYLASHWNLGSSLNRFITFAPAIPPPGAATLVSPSGSGVTNPVTYQWNRVSGATHYYLWVDGPNGNVIKTWYTASQAGCDTATTCSVTPSQNVAGGAHKWWIQTWNGGGYGPWSTRMEFDVPFPGQATLTSPVGGGVDNPVAYTWTAVPDATHYYLWVDGPGGNVIKTWYTATQAGCDTGGACAVTPSQNLAAGAHKWWIQTWNAYGYGPWSSRMEFDVSFPGPTTLSSPLSEGIANPVTYEWTAVPGATHYYLWVDGPNGNVVKTWYTAVQAGCGTDSTCAVTPGNQLAAGTYKWWIQTWNPAGYGPWAGPVVFTVAS